MPETKFLIYLITMAGVTYLIRLLPIILIKNKIENRFVLSFLHYVPYAVLSAMTVPAIFFATDSPISAAAGFIVAVLFAFFEKSLVSVALFACLATFVSSLVLHIL
jgi:branched-subunit amino acid transport protein